MEVLVRSANGSSIKPITNTMISMSNARKLLYVVVNMLIPENLLQHISTYLMGYTYVLYRTLLYNAPIDYYNKYEYITSLAISSHNELANKLMEAHTMLHMVMICEYNIFTTSYGKPIPIIEYNNAKKQIIEDYNNGLFLSPKDAYNYYRYIPSKYSQKKRGRRRQHKSKTHVVDKNITEDMFYSYNSLDDLVIYNNNNKTKTDSELLHRAILYIIFSKITINKYINLFDNISILPLSYINHSDRYINKCNNYIDEAYEVLPLNTVSLSLSSFINMENRYEYAKIEVNCILDNICIPVNITRNNNTLNWKFIYVPKVLAPYYINSMIYLSYDNIFNSSTLYVIFCMLYPSMTKKEQDSLWDIYVRSIKPMVNANHKLSILHKKNSVDGKDIINTMYTYANIEYVDTHKLRFMSYEEEKFLKCRLRQIAHLKNK